MSIREWRARRSSIWSRKPMPVATVETPAPSRSIATSTSVSLVARLTAALRMRAPDLPAFYQGLTGFATTASPGCGNCIGGGRTLHLGEPRPSMQQSSAPDLWHGTTILTVRKGGVVAIGGDGQVS